ncbi:MAG: hypothetical protein IEMM0008_1823 [bacterium]|nr:MAG: hypothetical protein IEMM0008_1823 [bacterium]
MEDRGVKRQLTLLKDILSQELALLNQIKEIENEKSRILSTTRHLVDLSPQNNPLEKLLNEENILEQRRNSLIKELSFYYQLDSLSLRELLSLIPAEEQKPMKKLWGSFQIIISEIKGLNSLNKVMINDTIKLLGYSFDLVAQERTLEIDYSKKNAQSKNYRSLVVDTMV